MRSSDLLLVPDVSSAWGEDTDHGHLEHFSFKIYTDAIKVQKNVYVVMQNQ